MDVSIYHFSDSTWKKLARTIAEKFLSVLVISRVRCIGIGPLTCRSVESYIRFGEKFPKEDWARKNCLEFKVSALRKSVIFLPVIFLPVDGAHREIT